MRARRPPASREGPGEKEDVVEEAPERRGGPLFAADGLHRAGEDGVRVVQVAEVGDLHGDHPRLLGSVEVEMEGVCGGRTGEEGDGGQRTGLRGASACIEGAPEFKRCG